MKVLITSERFPPDFAGGGEYVVLETARNLMRQGVDIQVLTAGDASIASYDGIPTVRLPIHRYRLNFAAPEIRAMASRVDLIHTFNYHACFSSLRAGRQLNKPVVCGILGLFQGAWREMRSRVAAEARIFWERFLLTRPFSRLIFLSEYSRQVGVSLGAEDRRSVVISPGIYVEQYHAAETKDDIVLFVGRVEARKGIADLLAVARMLPDLRFLVFGWGAEMSAVRAAAPANVDVQDFERGQKLRYVLSRARLFFFPTKAETFGISMVEAMASGCAIVSTVPLEFEGAHVESGDRDAMAAALRTLWCDPARSREMGRRNRQLAQPYSWDRSVSQTLAMYHEVLGEGCI
jgi:glycosyltransferase involved in cell wall biosynthesis